MATEIMSDRREFKIWAYTASHAQLLLRSTKTADCRTRVDILFKGVAAIHLPKMFSGIRIEEASEEQAERMNIQLGSFSLTDQTVFSVSGTNFNGYVVAVAVHRHEDEGEYYDPPHWGFPGWGEAKNRGRIFTIHKPAE